MPTPFLPLLGLQSWYDDGVATVTVNLHLLDATVDSFQDGYGAVADLPGRLATTGSYNTTTGIAAGSWPLYYDSTDQVMELSLPASSWTSSATYSLSFRWVAVALPGGTILTAVDYGINQTLTSAPLSVYATESTYIANSYPVFRWRKSA